MKRILLLLFILATAISASAQKEGAWWYFGYGQGLDFTNLIAGQSDVPTRLCDGPLDQTEGVFSISDTNGNFLMASNGRRVYGRDREEMAGSASAINIADQLSGCGTSTQSGIVVPFPGSDNKFYIFTVDCRETTVLRKPVSYTVVNMDLGVMTAYGPRGDIEGPKNTGLKFGAAGGENAETYENITAVPHTNGTDYWVITRTSRGFYAWQITPLGVSEEPKYLAATYGAPAGYYPGQPQRIQGGDGYIRASPDGKHIVSVILSNASEGAQEGPQQTNMTYVSFNASTGAFSNRRVFGMARRGIYGVEFSSNAKYIYFTQSALSGRPTDLPGLFRITTDYMMTSGSPDNLDQYTPSLPATLANRVFELDNLGVSTNIQMGPNGWLYMIQNKSYFLNIVKNTDAIDIDDVIVKRYPDFFKDCGQYLLGRIMGIGLPTFMPSFFYMGDPEARSVGCKNAEASFSVEADQGTGLEEAAYLEWNMGDGNKLYTGKVEPDGSGGWPDDNIHEVSHIYEYSGNYTITITPYMKSDGLPNTAKEKELNIYISECEILINPHLRGRVELSE